MFSQKSQKLRSKYFSKKSKIKVKIFLKKFSKKNQISEEKIFFSEKSIFTSIFEFLEKI